MNTTLAVVVSAIVILITALVVITIFSGGIGQVGSLTNANSICQTQAASSCRSTNSMPLIWDIPTVSIPNPNGQGNLIVACGGSGANDLKLGKDCSAFGGTATSSGGVSGTPQNGCCQYSSTCSNTVVGCSSGTFMQGKTCQGTTCV